MKLNVSRWPRSALLVFIIVALFLLQTVVTYAAPFTPGNLVIYRVGDGSGSLANTGNPVFLDEYTPSGTLVQSIPMPTTVSGSNKQLVASGTATSEGFLTLSSDRNYLVLTGYASDIPYSSSLPGTNATTIPRTVGRVDANANIDTSTALTDFASGSNPRGAATTNGTDIWVSGGAGGVRYISGLGGTTSTDLTSSTLGNVRVVKIAFDQLYVSSGSGTNTYKGVNTVGTGLPKTGPQTVTRLPGLTDATNPSTYSFCLMDLEQGVAGPDVLYVADDGVGALTKFSLVSGAWSPNGTVGVDTDDYRGLTCVRSGTSVTLYAVRKGGSIASGGGEFVTITDSSGYNGAFSGTPTLLATAGTNTAFRGIAFAPGTAPTAVTLRGLTAVAPLSPLAVILPALGLVAAGGVAFCRRRKG